MATVNVKVPTTSNLTKRRAWMAEVSNLLIDGSDVNFIDDDEDGADTQILYLNLHADGVVNCRGLDEDDDKARILYFIKGGWHMQPIGFIWSAGTDTGLRMTVALEGR